MESPLCLLKIDVDAGQKLLPVATYSALLRRAGKRMAYLRQSRSRSGKGWHIVLHVVPSCRTPMEVVALQAALGSDPFRECCNVLRVNNLGKVPRYWRTRWNVFYKGR